MLFIFILLFSNWCRAQFMDTLHEIFRNKSNIDARLESRYTWIDHNLTSVTGVRLGVAFQRKLRLGGGISWFKNDIDYKVTFIDQNDASTKITRYLKYGYACFYADFVYYRTKRWQLSVPIQAGLGMLWYQKNTGYDIFGKDTKYALFLYEPGTTVQFKVFKWFGLGSDVGYRFALKDNKKIGEHLSSPMYSFKILFWFDQLFFDVLPDNELSKKYGPATW